MPALAPHPRQSFRFALPPSLGPEVARERAPRLAHYLSRLLTKSVDVVVAPSYEALAKELLAGKVDAAWAPPFVCARVEAMGVRVLVRGVRQGVSSYRAALLCLAGRGLTLGALSGLTAMWVDRDSVAGYLLPMAFLKSQGLDSAKTFFAQSFAGSYKAALEGVIEGKADVCSVFAPATLPGEGVQTGVEEICTGWGGKFRVIAFTEEAPNDGVAVAMATDAVVVHALEEALLSFQESDEGKALLRQLFNADRFELAPRMGYRALYRVALATL